MTRILLEQQVDNTSFPPTERNELVLSRPHAVTIVSLASSVYLFFIYRPTVSPESWLYHLDELQTAWAREKDCGCQTEAAKVLSQLKLIIGSLVDSLSPHRPPPLLGRVG